MTIEELDDKHFNIPDQCYRSSEKHTNLSIQFAIEVLEEFTTQYCECGMIDDNIAIENKIQKLKKYLDGN